jgi:hypothetical protein
MSTSKSIIKFSSKKELALSYGITIKTLNKSLKPFEDRIGKKVTRYYTPLQVSIIYECLGLPNSIATE